MASLNRVVMQKESRDWVNSLGPEDMDVLELSGKWGQGFPFRSYRGAEPLEVRSLQGADAG